MLRRGATSAFSSDISWDPDYMVQPLDIDPAVELVLGGASATAAAAAAVLFVCSDRFDRRWWSVVVPLLAAGAICGGGWSLITAPIIGAPIGGGLALLAGPPIVVAVLVWAAVNWSRLRQVRRSP